MDLALIHHWNSRVSNVDTIYIIGDFAFRDHEEMLQRVNGRKHFVIGSHDKELIRPKYAKYFESINQIKEIEIEEQTISLCHYAFRTWPKMHYGAWHLHGHSHGNLEPMGKSWDVGVDNNGYHPISWEEIKQIMVGRPENPTLHKTSPWQTPPDTSSAN